METKNESQQNVEESKQEVEDNSKNNLLVESSEKSNTSDNTIKEIAADMKTDGSSTKPQDSNLEEVTMKMQEEIQSSGNQIEPEIIAEENCESIGAAENFKTYVTSGDNESVRVIENITIVPPKQELMERTAKLSESIIEENSTHIVQSKEDSITDDETMSNEESPNNTNCNKTVLEESSGDSVTRTESTFLPEATVANYLKNSGLSFLQSQYGTDNSDECDSDNDSIVETSNQEANDKEYRDKIIVNSSDSDDSDVEFLSAEQQQKIIDLDEFIDEDDEEQQNNKHKGPIRVKGELLLEDLPPIQDLKITVPETECVELGKIHSIVDQLVLVDSIPGTVPLDLDTILFMDKGKTVLGEVFDVLGQIKSPIYCVRFNSNKQIKEKGIEIGQTVFVAPRTEHTQFIILDNLMRIRGSDASWENDIEPNDKHRDFSDDEEEINYRRNLHNKDRPNDHNDLSKRTRTASTSSSMCSGTGDVAESVELKYKNNQHRNQQRYNYSENQRFPANRSGGYQPRQQFQRGGGRGRQNHNQNTSRFNYDSSGTSWHANYNNNYGNDYYQQQQLNSYQQQQPNSYQQQQPNSYQHQSQPQPRYEAQQFPPPQPHQQSTIIAQSNLYPNPYAIRSPYIPPNVMQQPLFPPPQAYSTQTEQQPLPNYPPQ